MNKTMPRTKSHLKSMPNRMLVTLSKQITDEEEKQKVVAEISRRKRKHSRRV